MKIRDITKIFNCIHDFDSILDECNKFSLNGVMQGNHHNVEPVSVIWENRLEGFLAKHETTIEEFCADNNVEYKPLSNCVMISDYSLLKLKDIIEKMKEAANNN